MYAATTVGTIARRTRIPQAASSLIARRGYHENIVEHYENPRNVGSLDKNDENVGTVRDLFCSGRDSFVWMAMPVGIALATRRLFRSQASHTNHTYTTLTVLTQTWN